MNYNSIFEDLVDSINTIAKGYGFTNGIQWAYEAHKRGYISYEKYMKYSNAHELRVRFSHGNARDIAVSYETYNIVRMWEQDIRYSSLRKNRGQFDERYSHNTSRRKHHYHTPEMPLGGFRCAPYIKTFKRVGNDGEEYRFKFAIYKENNYMDDGNGGTYDYGYFIHIEEAPYLNYALEHLHTFHIISCKYECHICWNKNIERFDNANAVMYVWVNRYVEMIDAIKETSSISESQLLRRADRKQILPRGTFRFSRYKEAGRVSSRNNDCLKSQMPKAPQTIYIMQKAYDRIMADLGSAKPELGGMLGCTLDYNTIDTYIFDSKARVNSVEYNPNIEYLQSILDGEWHKKGIFLGGFVHSHPGNFNQLSYADVDYAVKIMKAFDMPYIFMPIVTSSYAYKSSITGYVVNANGYVERCLVEVVPGREKKTSSDETSQPACVVDVSAEEDFDPSVLESIMAGFAEMDSRYSAKFDATLDDDKKSECKPSVIQLSQNDVFARISGVLDIPYLSECSVIGIGCGGARSFYESMARMGIGRFFLMDGDIVSKSNVASQNAYLSEVGKHKPEVVRNKILDINDEAEVTCFNHMLSDEFDDKWLEREIISKIDTNKTVICAFTDDFYAQARISRIALKYHIPFIAGQHHERGVTSELVYWYPDVTKYSLRDIVYNRYEAYESGYKNEVTSVGSPIFNTTRLNALCEKVAMGLLVYGYDRNSKYCRFLNEANDRNVMLIRQSHIDCQNQLYSLFENGFNSYFDDVAWILASEFVGDTDSIEEGTVGDTRDIF